MTDRPRIGLVLGTSTGGVGVHVLSLVRALLADGWPVTVAGPESTHAVFDFAGAGADLAVVPIRSAGREILAVPALRRALAPAALVHAHGLRAATACVLAELTQRPRAGGNHHRGLGRPPLIAGWHNAVLTTGAAGRLMTLGEQLVARRATVNLAASADLTERIRRLGGRDARTMPVAAPTPRPVRTPAEVRAELGLAPETGPGSRALVLAVGRLHEQKAPGLLVAAAARWALRSPAPLVVIAGDGPLRGRLEAEISAAGAPVRLLGRRSDVADLLAAADVVVLPSRWEARPLAVQEAMVLGRPVVASEVGGVADLVGDGARLVPAGDLDALVDAVQTLLDDGSAREVLGARARLVAATWPDEAGANAAVIAVYRSLLGEQ